MSKPNEPRGGPGRGHDSNAPDPGRIALWLLNLVIPRDFSPRDAMIGDVFEGWDSTRRALGPAAARRWLWGEVIRSFPSMLGWRLERRITMLLSEEALVRAVQIALVVYLLPAILMTLLALGVAIVLAHLGDAAEWALFGEDGGRGEDPVESHPAIIDASGQALAAFDSPVEFLFEILFNVPGLSDGAWQTWSYDITPGPGTRWDYAAVSRVGWELRLCGAQPGAGADHLIQYRGVFPWLEFTGTQRVILHWRAPIRVVGGPARWKEFAHISVTFYKRP